jgi:hypothetical protein
VNRIILEVELLDDEGTWTAEDMPDLAERVRKQLRWHGVAQEAFCGLGKITARKVGEE